MAFYEHSALLQPPVAATIIHFSYVIIVSFKNLFVPVLWQYVLRQRSCEPLSRLKPSRPPFHGKRRGENPGHWVLGTRSIAHDGLAWTEISAALIPAKCNLDQKSVTRAEMQYRLMDHTRKLTGELNRMFLQRFVKRSFIQLYFNHVDCIPVWCTWDWVCVRGGRAGVPKTD